MAALRAAEDGAGRSPSTCSRCTPCAGGWPRTLRRTAVTSTPSRSSPDDAGRRRPLRPRAAAGCWPCTPPSSASTPTRSGTRCAARRGTGTRRRTRPSVPVDVEVTAAGRRHPITAGPRATSSSSDEVYGFLDEDRRARARCSSASHGGRTHPLLWARDRRRRPGRHRPARSRAGFARAPDPPHDPPARAAVWADGPLHEAEVETTHRPAGADARRRPTMTEPTWSPSPPTRRPATPSARSTCARRSTTTATS